MMNTTGIKCDCGECDYAENGFPFGSYVALGKAVIANLDARGTLKYDDWLKTTGEPHVNPVVFTAVDEDSHEPEEDDCFGGLVEDLTEISGDSPRVSVLGEITECDFCGASIVKGTPVIAIAKGNLVLSRQTPPGVNPVDFRMDKSEPMTIVCLQCAKGINTARNKPIWRGSLY